MNKIVLACVDYYLPGYKAGGPIRTLANMVEQLGDKFAFRVITRDRDFQDREPYPNIQPCQWNQLGKAEVFYLSPEKVTLRTFQSILSETEYDILYLNSFFSPRFTISPLLLQRLKFISNRPIVLAPRGEFPQEH